VVSAGTDLCDAVASLDVMAGRSCLDGDEAVLLGTVLRGVAAVATYAHPSAIHAAGWLRGHPATAASTTTGRSSSRSSRRADGGGIAGGGGGGGAVVGEGGSLPAVIAALVRIADPPTPWPVSVSGLDSFTYAGPRTGASIYIAMTIYLLEQFRIRVVGCTFRVVAHLSIRDRSCGQRCPRYSTALVMSLSWSCCLLAAVGLLTGRTLTELR
jgi:hypothetical protein